MGQAAFRQSGGRKPLGAFPNRMPNWRPAATASGALRTMCSPGAAMLVPDGFAPVMKRETARWRSSRDLRRSQRPRTAQQGQRGRDVRAAIREAKSSSAGRITDPLKAHGLQPGPLSAKAIASREPRNSMYATPMLVMMAESGRASFASGAISPG